MKFTEFLLKNNIHELIIFILIGAAIYITIKKILLASKEKINKRQQTIKKLIVNIAKYVIIILLILKLLTILGINVTSIIAGLGIVSVIIGLALQDIMKDVLSGMFIIIENQYDIGDEVKINNYQGTIVDLGLRSTVLKTLESQIVTIANRNITEVTNYSKEKPTIVLDLPVPYEISNEKALKLLESIKQKAEETIPDKVKDIKILGIQSFDDSSIKYRISLITKKDQRYTTLRQMNMIIKETYDKAKVSIPYNIVEVRNGN